MSNYAQDAALLSLMTRDPRTAIDATSAMAVADGQSDGPSSRTVSIPADFDRASLEALGFTEIGKQPNDPEERTKSFVKVQLPNGWTIQDGSAPGIRDIRDQLGVKRVTTTDNGQWWDRFVSTSILRQGFEVPLRLVYGNAQLSDVSWEHLTASERAEVVIGLKRYVAQGKESPNAYRDTAAKAQAWIDRIEALPSD